MTNYDDYFSGYDSSFEEIFDDYIDISHQRRWMFIFKKDNKYYSIEGRHYIGRGLPIEYSWEKDLVSISEKEMYDLMDEWDYE